MDNPLASLEDILPDPPATLARFRFIKDSPLYQSEKPYHFSGPLDSTEESLRTNLTFEWHCNIPVKDIRKHATKVKLDVHGFQVLEHTSKFLDCVQETIALEAYMNESIDLLKAELNADVVICFDYRV
jgi:hypothetical protein